MRKLLGLFMLLGLLYGCSGAGYLPYAPHALDPASLQSLVTEASSRNGVSPALVNAVVMAESAVALAGLMQLAQLEVGAMNSLTNILLARGDLDHVLEVGGQALDKSETRGELSTGSV